MHSAHVTLVGSVQSSTTGVPDDDEAEYQELLVRPSSVPEFVGHNPSPSHWTLRFRPGWSVPKPFDRIEVRGAAYQIGPDLVLDVSFWGEVP